MVRQGNTAERVTVPSPGSPEQARHGQIGPPSLPRRSGPLFRPLSATAALLRGGSSRYFAGQAVTAALPANGASVTRLAGQCLCVSS